MSYPGQNNRMMPLFIPNGMVPTQQPYPAQMQGFPQQGGYFMPRQIPPQYSNPLLSPAANYFPPTSPLPFPPMGRNMIGMPYGQDPLFSPTDPTMAQANYPQAPGTFHNQSPYPVPYGQLQQMHNNSNSFNSMNGIVMHVDQKYQNIPPPNFRLSNCQGRKRALLIGINYFGTEVELKGCINDVHNVKNFLVTLYGFRIEDMVILTDDQSSPQNIPTKANMIRAMQWLVHDSRPNDSFFFHFSGHGGRVKDYDGDEDDGWDETIYPVDYKNAGQIVDDMMNDIMVRRLVVGCRLTAIFDSCHSGTALDLPYVYTTKGTLKEYSPFKSTASSLQSVGHDYMSGNSKRAISDIMSFGSRLLHGGFSSSANRNREARNRLTKGSLADVIMLSGCRDDQTSADSQEAGRATGALSYALTTSLRENRHQTYLQLLNNLRQILGQKYNQRPQLSSSHPMDVNLLFML